MWAAGCLVRGWKRSLLEGEFSTFCRHALLGLVVLSDVIPAFSPVLFSYFIPCDYDRLMRINVCAPWNLSCWKMVRAATIQQYCRWYSLDPQRRGDGKAVTPYCEKSVVAACTEMTQLPAAGWTPLHPPPRSPCSLIVCTPSISRRPFVPSISPRFKMLF